MDQNIANILLQLLVGDVWPLLTAVAAGQTLQAPVAALANPAPALSTPPVTPALTIGCFLLLTFHPLPVMLRPIAISSSSFLPLFNCNLWQVGSYFISGASNPLSSFILQ